MGDLSILEIILQFIEQGVVNSKKAEKTENCNDNNYYKKVPFFDLHLGIC